LSWRQIIPQIGAQRPFTAILCGFWRSFP